MVTERLRVLVIGGGIGGLCLAQGLRRAGRSVAVYERDRSRSERLDRYRLHINPAGSRALRACLSGRAWESYLATAGTPGGGFGFLTPQLATLVVVDDSIMYPDTADPAEMAYPVDRSSLRQALLTGLGEAVNFDKSFDYYQQTAEGRVTAFFTDGTSASGDVLVGADGINSRVARQLLPAARQTEAGAVGIGLRLPLTTATRSWLPARLAVGENMIFSSRPFFLFTSVFERAARARGPFPPDLPPPLAMARRTTCSAHSWLAVRAAHPGSKTLSLLSCATQSPT
jgi:2-polyprenyl-6-methoxyphenol hydroxylase-like FAD-dependent oxidoreductase